METIKKARPIYRHPRPSPPAAIRPRPIPCRRCGRMVYQQKPRKRLARCQPGAALEIIGTTVIAALAAVWQIIYLINWTQ